MLKLGLAVFFAMNVMVFSMALWTNDVYGEELRAAGPLADALHDVFRYLALVFCVPVLFLLGEPLAVGVWQALRRGVVTTDLLLLIGVLAAVAYSLGSVVAGEGRIYFDVATMILMFVTLGRWFEAQGKLRAGQALDALAKLLPEKVHALRSNSLIEVARESVAVGDRLCVFPGERFAVDGIIARGRGEVDEQMLTGEARPVARGPGDRISSGTLNLDGNLEVVVTAAAGAETVSRMLELVRKSRRARGRYQRLSDRAATWFVPAVALAALAAAAWHGSRDGVGAGILTGLAVALIACPCALALATPMALWIALGRAARGQVLFRHGQALEQLGGLRALLVDKTGTLTTGDSDVESFVTCDRAEANRSLELAAALATTSNHWYASAIRRFANRPATAERLDDVRTIPGKGIQARWKDGAGPDGVVLLGSPQWLREAGLTVPDEFWQAVEKSGGGDLPLSCIGWGGRVRGAFVFREQLRPEARQALDQCRRMGIQVRVVTGDRRGRATALAEELGVPVLAEQLPEDKVAAIAEARHTGPVAMVGDGVNDAPALAASDVGIAMGCGADLSRESAAVCLLSNDLERLPWTIGLARQTVRVIRQNLYWAFGYNVIGIGLAASGRLSPVFSALAMVASSALVVSNSLRLNRFPDVEARSVDVGRQSADGSAGSAGADAPSAAGDPISQVSELQLTT